MSDSIRDNLQRIANLIRKQPSLTVREIAAILGYSEGKSVYYWLTKAGFHGIKDFRDQVFQGNYPPLPLPPPAVAGEEPERYTTLDYPLVEAVAPSGRPLFANRPYRLHWPTDSQKAFLFRLKNPEYSPFLLAGDVLLVDPSARGRDGQLVLIHLADREPQVRRFYRTEQGPFLLHPAQPEVAHKPPQTSRLHVLGVIIRVIREAT